MPRMPSTNASTPHRSCGPASAQAVHLDACAMHGAKRRFGSIAGFSSPEVPKAAAPKTAKTAASAATLRMLAAAGAAQVGLEPGRCVCFQPRQAGGPSAFYVVTLKHLSQVWLCVADRVPTDSQPEQAPEQTSVRLRVRVPLEKMQLLDVVQRELGAGRTVWPSNR